MATSQPVRSTPPRPDLPELAVALETATGAFSGAVAELAASELGATGGVEAAFLSRDGHEVFVVAREHGMVDRTRLLEAEAHIEERLGPVVFSIRASQGREPGAMFEGLQRIL